MKIPAVHIEPPDLQWGKNAPEDQRKTRTKHKLVWWWLERTAALIRGSASASERQRRAGALVALVAMLAMAIWKRSAREKIGAAGEERERERLCVQPMWTIDINFTHTRPNVVGKLRRAQKARRG